MSSSYSNDYDQILKKIQELLDTDFNDETDNYSVTLTAPTNQWLQVSAKASQIEEIVKDIDYIYRTIYDKINYKLKRAEEIIRWASLLAINQKIFTMVEFNSCVRLIISDYIYWGDNAHWLKFEKFYAKIQNLVKEYYNVKPIYQARFPNALSAVSHFVKHGKGLNCHSLKEYMLLAGKAYGKGRKTITKMSDGVTCEKYEYGNTFGVYYIRRGVIKIATFYRKTSLKEKTM